MSYLADNSATKSTVGAPLKACNTIFLIGASGTIKSSGATANVSLGND